MCETTQTLYIWQNCTFILSLFRSSISIFALVVICCVVTGGLAATQSKWGRVVLRVRCNRHQGEALFSVQSRYSKSKEDRRWKWRCKRIVSGAMSTCYWTGYQSNLNEPFLFHCPANYVLSGVKSVHFKKRKDRRWNFYCCRGTGYCTKQCYWSKYINKLRGFMKYTASDPRVFIGAYSYRSNKKR